MAMNPFAFSQSPDASRMPQVGFGQSNPSPQYGGMPNQNAFTNANSAANLYSRFGSPSTGGGLPLPGSPPTPSPDGMLSYMPNPFTMSPAPAPTQDYGRPNMGMGNPYLQRMYQNLMGRQNMPFRRPFGGPNMQAFQNANPNAGLYDRFGGGMYTTQPVQPTVNYLAYPR